MFLANDYGPFAPMVGYVGAGIATVSAIAVTWRGSLKKWKPPEEDLPNVAQKGVTAMSFIGMVGLWLYATPGTLPVVFWIGVACGVVLFLCLLTYPGLIGKHTYNKEIVVSATETKVVRIVGGWRLKPEAQAQFDQLKKDRKLDSVQEFLEGKAYHEEALWEPESRRQVKTVLILLFILALLSGTLGVAAAGFAVQVRLTDRPAADAIMEESVQP